MTKATKQPKVVYTVKRSGGLPKTLKGQAFTTYEQARCAVRRYIRTMKNYTPTATNPALGEFGFSIVKG